MCEAITGIEIIFIKPMIQMDTCLKILEHTLDIFNECCTSLQFLEFTVIISGFFPHLSQFLILRNFAFSV
jgi:hypothetical protein